MAVKIRLQRKGRKKAPYYHIVIADARSPRDGKFIERIGMYNPIHKPAIVEIDRDKAFEWLMKGAQPTDTIKAILKYKGVMYRKHLQRGVSKGSFPQETADQMYQDWIVNKESTIASKVEARKMEISEYHKEMIAVNKPTEAPVEETKSEEE
ncbi:MAG: 30S ribosomal protein S16 [Bacteroidota bacterium]|nr:30S ribosomal protein S16 [Bacteroidota bacterium]